MKTTKAFLPLPLLTFLISLTLSGCYTQLAFVDDDSTPSPIYIYQPIIMPVVPIQPISPIGPAPIEPISPPIINPLLPAGYSPTMSAPPPPPRIRETGYQRPDQSGTTQSTNSTSNNRPIGSTRGG